MDYSDRNILSREQIAGKPKDVEIDRRTKLEKKTDDRLRRIKRLLRR